MDSDDKKDNHKSPGGANDSQKDDSAQLKKSQDNAADLIRNKLDEIYNEEPEAEEEAIEAIEASTPRSKYQQYMYDLSRSGQSLAEIQQAWHDYYARLSDKEKHEVWKEFYAANGQNIPSDSTFVGHIEQEKTESPRKKKKPAQKASDKRSVGDIKKKILSSASANKKLKARQHFQSLIFGLSMGALVVLFLLFGFFNERFVAPFITPSKQVSSTPIIIDSTSTVASGPPKIIIPKINVEIPVIYNKNSTDEATIQKDLEKGVAHYSTTSNPGELGNTVIFGHSSNNIFNPGKYKFAFVLLSRLENGDTFYLTKNNKRYAYKVFSKKVVDPTDVSVLGDTSKKASATLITCDPPGTSLKRLVVVGEQISPDPTTNKKSTAISTSTEPTVLPSNAPSLWERFTNWLNN